MKKLLCILGMVLLLSGCGNSTNELDLNRIKSELSNLDNNGSLMFKNNEEITSEVLKNKYGVDTSLMKEFIVYMPTLIESSNMYIIVKYDSANKNSVKAELDKLITKYEDQWSLGYAPLEESKVRDRLEKEVGNCFVVIVSDDNEKVFEIINK